MDAQMKPKCKRRGLGLEVVDLADATRKARGGNDEALANFSEGSLGLSVSNDSTIARLMRANIY